MHEVGHTLGLRHNFRGSAGATAAQLANRGWTASHGFGVSVMDYSPPALAARSRRGRATTTPPPSAATIAGRSRYGYADVVTSVASRSRDAKGAGPDVAGAGRPTSRSTGSAPSPSQAADPAHLYGTDEDAGFGGLGLDPTVSPLRPDRRPAGLGARTGRADQRPLRFARDPGGGAGPGLRPAAGRLHRPAERPLVRPAGHDQVPRRRHHLA